MHRALHAPIFIFSHQKNCGLAMRDQLDTNCSISSSISDNISIVTNDIHMQDLVLGSGSKGRKL